MFFVVTSNSRLAVRKLLTAAGMDSQDVRKMTLGQLGKALHDKVQASIITETDAKAACQSIAETTPTHDTDTAETDAETVDAPITVAVSKVTRPNDAAMAALAALQEALAKNATVDEAAVREIARKLVREELTEAGRKPALIEIRTETHSVTLDGAKTHAMLETVIRTISTRVQGRRLHVWLVGPSGSGKSYLASQAASALKLDYYSTSAIQSKYDLIGFQSPTGNEATLMTPFRRAFEFGGVFAWDDIDASDPRAFVAFNEALANGRFAFPDKMVEAHTDFVCVASANTWGTGATADYVGRNKIDQATLSRFVRWEIAYDEQLERDLVGNEHEAWARFVQRIRAAVTKEGIKVLVTPRHTLQGAALIAAGMARDKVERATVFAGLDSETVQRLQRAA